MGSKEEEEEEERERGPIRQKKVFQRKRTWGRVGEGGFSLSEAAAAQSGRRRRRRRWRRLAKYPHLHANYYYRGQKGEEREVRNSPMLTPDKKVIGSRFLTLFYP